MRGEGAADVGDALGASEEGLGLRGDDAANGVVVDGDLGGEAECAGEALGLIEFALAKPRGIKRDRDDGVELIAEEMGFGGIDEERCEEWLEPEGAVVFVFVEEIEHAITSDDDGAGGGELELVFAAVRAFKGGGDCAFEGKPAAFAERRFDEMDFVAARVADVVLIRSRARVAAELAGFGIEKRRGGIEPACERRGKRRKLRHGVRIRMPSVSPRRIVKPV